MRFLFAIGVFLFATRAVDHHDPYAFGAAAICAVLALFWRGEVW